MTKYVKRPVIVEAMQMPTGPARHLKPIVAAKTDVEAVVERDQWDRPRIKTPDGKIESYARVSTVAETLDDKSGLMKWKAAQALRGAALRPDIALASHTASKSELYKLTEAAEEAAGSSAAASNGTSLHRFTEKVDAGLEIGKAPANVSAMLKAYEAGLKKHKIEILDMERFVANHKIKVAGTYDRRVFHPDVGECIGDLKTRAGELKYLALKTCAQVSMYAASPHYELDGTTEPHGAHRDRGLLFWLPWCEDAQDAHFEIRWLDLAIGRKATMLAIRVREIRKLSMDQLMPHVR